MKKVKTLGLFLIMPALLLSSCSFFNGGGNDKDSSIVNSSSEQQGESSVDSQNTSSERGSSKDSSEDKGYSSSAQSSSASSSSSKTYSSWPDPSPSFVPYQNKVTVLMSAGLNESKPNYSVEFQYDDSYFVRNPAIYDKGLSMLSFASSLATSTKQEAIDFFAGGQFQDITTYHLDETPTSDSIGFAFGHKTVDTSELFAVSIRGFNYGLEWANNFKIGKTGNHEGFDGSAQIVRTELLKYINLYKGSKAAKIWVSGYSRAGAVANALVYNPALLGVDNNAIYAYTFEAPASLDSSNCNEDINVHNVLNSGDVIAAVVPSNYNIGRCGTVYPIYDEDAANIVKAFDNGIDFPEFSPISGGSKTINNDHELVEYIINAVYNVQTDNDDAKQWTANSRSEYVDRYQSGLSYIVGLLFNMSSSNRSKMLKDLQDLGFSALTVLGSGQSIHDFMKPYFDADGISYDDDALLEACNVFQKAIQYLFFNILLLYMNEQSKPSLTRVINMHYPEVTYALLVNAHNK